MARMMISLHGSHDNLIDSLNAIPVPPKHQSAITNEIAEKITGLKREHSYFKVVTESSDQYDHLIFLAPGANIAPGIGLTSAHIGTDRVFWAQWKEHLAKRMVDFPPLSLASVVAIEARTPPYPYTNRLLVTIQHHLKFYAHCLKKHPAYEIIDSLIYITTITQAEHAVGMHIALMEGAISDKHPINTLIAEA